MALLEVDLTVELENPPVFYKWLPLRADETPVSDHEGVRVEVGFKVESTSSPFRSSEDDIRRTANNAARRLFVKARVGISNELANYIQNPDESVELATEYKALGAKLQQAIVRIINRLLAYLKAMKKQFWIEELAVDFENPGQFFKRHQATATIDGKNVRFDPDRGIIKFEVKLSDPKVSMHQDEWADALAYAIGQDRLPMVDVLLSNARNLMFKGYRRNALVDAATALEVALSQFAHSAEMGLLGSRQSRIEPTSIQSLIAKVGFRGSFGVVLPFIFEEEDFPSDLLSTCRTAIDQRNNVVHHGKRDVNAIELTTMINAIDEACSILRKFSEKRPGNAT